MSTIFTRAIPALPADVGGLTGWRAALARSGVTVTWSSGTTGRMSFVPRDAITWRALCTNGRTYARADWAHDGAGRPRPFDCFVVGPKGAGMGIQGAAAGLARSAARAHYLFEGELTGDLVRRAGAEGIAAEALGAGGEAGQAATVRARAFLDAAIALGRPVLVFGAPFQVRRFCDALGRGPGGVALPEGSMLVTGGGWKAFSGERIRQVELLALVERSLGIPAARAVDAYSTAELNCTFTSCAAQRYHIPPLVEPVVLDEAYFGEVGATGAGYLGFLDPFAASYPGFVVTGDRVQLGRGPCPCGLVGHYLEGEITRAPQREVKGCGGVLASVAV